MKTELERMMNERMEQRKKRWEENRQMALYQELRRRPLRLTSNIWRGDTIRMGELYRTTYHPDSQHHFVPGSIVQIIDVELMEDYASGAEPGDIVQGSDERKIIVFTGLLVIGSLTEEGENWCHIPECSYKTYRPIGCLIADELLRIVDPNDCTDDLDDMLSALGEEI